MSMKINIDISKEKQLYSNFLCKRFNNIIHQDWDLSPKQHYDRCGCVDKLIIKLYKKDVLEWKNRFIEQMTR